MAAKEPDFICGALMREREGSSEVGVLHVGKQPLPFLSLLAAEIGQKLIFVGQNESRNPPPPDTGPPLGRAACTGRQPYKLQPPLILRPGSVQSS